MLLVFWDADAGVRHSDPHLASCRFDFVNINRESHPASVSKLDSVRQQIEEHLPQARWVAGYPFPHFLADAKPKLKFLGSSLSRHYRDGTVGNGSQTYWNIL